LAEAPANTAPDKIRVDRWLFFARFFKTRGLAAKRVTGGHVRVNAVKISKSAQMVGPGDTLTFAQGDSVRVVRITACGNRRGPAPEAQALYDDLTPVVEFQPAPVKSDRKGRPTKKERRNMVKSRRDVLD
jgi:ribosome-associated heat shock protein Hsp15